MNRISQLEGFLKEEPNDPFNHYALALEYLKTDVAKAQALFETLTKNFPEYLPTYYPFAHLMIDQNRPKEAETLFEKGKQMALQKGDHKTFRELQSAYNDWQFERD